MLSSQCVRRGLLASSAAVSILLASTAAFAGGFHVREQSTEFQGMSFAGNAAAGGGLSGMFWNPAIAAYAPVGVYTESHMAGIFGHVDMNGATFAANGTNLNLPPDSGNIAKIAAVPSSYMSYRLSRDLVVAVSVNSPFGLVTEPSNRFWAGQTFARTSEIKTYNVTPTLAYRIMPSLAIGVGIQVEHITGRLKNASGVTQASLNSVIEGDDTAFGFTAGISFTPTSTTSIGLGYRSSIDHTLEGSINIPGSTAAGGLAASGASIKAGTTLPEIVTASFRQALTPQLSLLGTAEWMHWSRAEKLDIVCANNSGGNPVFCPAGNGQLVRSLDLGWHDSWFFSLGAEYAYSKALTLRGGMAYELSPIQNADERTLRTPDVDRIWASVGATYQWSDKMTFDLAYTHIFGLDGDIDRVEGTGASALRFVGSVNSSVDIVSVSMKMKLGAF